MTDDLERFEAALSNAREDDYGNDELCMEAAMRLAELRLNLRLTRKRLDAALSRAAAAEEGRQDAMATLVQARSRCWPDKLDRAIMLIGGRVWNALDHGHQLDDYDGERIREALALLQEMSPA